MWNSRKKAASKGKQSPWKELNSSDQVAKIKEASRERPVVIFKHSTRCGISMAALRKVNAEMDALHSATTPYLLDLLQHRDISNQIASEFNVHHESPQVIVIQDGKAVYHASHHSIEVPAMLENLRS